MQFPEGLENTPFNRNTFFLHEMDKLTVVLMSYKMILYKVFVYILLDQIKVDSLFK